MRCTPHLQITSTSSLAGPDRFSYWADVVTQTFVPLQCDTPDRHTFFGNLRHRQIGLVGIADVQASAMRVARTAATIAHAPSDDLIVVLQIDGICQTGQNNSSGQTPSRRQRRRHDGRMLFFRLPRKLPPTRSQVAVEPDAAGADRANARTIIVAVRGAGKAAATARAFTIGRADGPLCRGGGRD